jgi:hypothetical protein
LSAPSTGSQCGHGRCEGAFAKCAGHGILQGQKCRERSRTFALDGKAMSETIAWLNINGKPEITSDQFVRVR